MCAWTAACWLQSIINSCPGEKSFRTSEPQAFRLIFFAFWNSSDHQKSENLCLSWARIHRFIIFFPAQNCLQLRFIPMFRHNQLSYQVHFIYTHSTISIHNYLRLARYWWIPDIYHPLMSILWMFLFTTWILFFWLKIDEPQKLMICNDKPHEVDDL